MTDEADNVVLTGGNATNLKRAIKVAADRIIKLKAERIEINSIINGIKSGLVEQGINKRAFNRALQDYETNESEDGADKRRETDEAYWLAREAMGLPSQVSMFEDAA